MIAIATAKQHQQQREGLVKLVQAAVDSSVATPEKQKREKKSYQVWGVPGWTGPRPRGILHG
jgi:hypothetical protein